MKRVNVMESMFFYLDMTALLGVALLGVVLFILSRWRLGFFEPYLRFSSVNILSTKKGKVSWFGLPRQLMWGALFCFCCAFIDPHFLVDRQKSHEKSEDRDLPTPVEGMAVYLVLDQSGSMKEEVAVGRRKKQRKVDLLREVTKRFVEGDVSSGLSGRFNDMIGLVFFARGAHVQSPLTLDHGAIVKELNQFEAVEVEDQDGTSIGYAIFKTASLIAATKHYAKDLIERGEPSYNIKSSVIILVTDGLQDPNPLDKGKRLRNIDVPEAAAYAKQEGIRLYVINVEPKLATEKFTPYRNIMTRAAESTGGKFYMIENQGSLEEIYQEIDRLEKSSLPQLEALVDKEKRPDLYKRISFYPYLIALGLFLMLLSCCLEATVLRRSP